MSGDILPQNNGQTSEHVLSDIVAPPEIEIPPPPIEIPVQTAPSAALDPEVTDHTRQLIRRRGRDYRFRPRQLNFATFWVAATGGNPEKLEDIRRVVSKRYTTRAIRRAIAVHQGGDLTSLAAWSKGAAAEFVMPPRLPFYTRPSKRMRRQLRFAARGQFLKKIVSAQGLKQLPPIWDKVAGRYKQYYPLRYQAGEGLLDEGEKPDEAGPLRLLSQYWAPDLVRPKGRQFADGILRLDHIPRVPGADIEAELRPHTPFLCFVGDTAIRNGSPEAGKDGDGTVKLLPWDITLLNCLMVSQLRTGRPVGADRMERLTGLNRQRLLRNLGYLAGKLNRPDAAATIITTSRGLHPHFAINRHAVVVDARTLVQRTAVSPSQDTSHPTTDVVHLNQSQ